MDQRMVLVNVLGMWAVLFLIVSVNCFAKYILLRRQRRIGYLSYNRYEMRRLQNRHTCNKLAGLTFVAPLVIYVVIVSMNSTTWSW